MSWSDWQQPSLRIRAEEVREGYFALGITPERGKCSACGLAAILGPDWEWEHPYDARPHFVKGYLSGFQYGFDGDGDGRRALRKAGSPVAAGYEDGRAAWEAVKDLAEP